MISSLLHLVGLRPRDYYTLSNFKGGGGKAPLPPPLNTPMVPYVQNLPYEKKIEKPTNCRPYVDLHKIVEAREQ